MPRLLYPFLVYRSFFFPFFVLSSITVPCWLIFRLYRHRTLGHPLSLRRELLLLTFVVYLCGLATATLTPNHGSSFRADAIVLDPSLASLTCSSGSLPTGSSARFFCLYNARGNVLLFIPLGVLIPLVRRRRSFWNGILVAVAVSVSIEILQYFSSAWGAHRTADVNDIILNGVGAFVGLTLVFLLRWLRGLSGAPRPTRG